MKLGAAKPFIGSPFIGSPFIGKPFVGIPFIGSPFMGKPFIGIPFIGIPFAGISDWLVEAVASSKSIDSSDDSHPTTANEQSPNSKRVLLPMRISFSLPVDCKSRPHLPG